MPRPSTRALRWWRSIQTNDLIALCERWKAPLVQVNTQQADQPSVMPASAQANWYASASDGASSPDALRHEFESYLRDPKITRTSSLFAGLVT